MSELSYWLNLRKEDIVPTNEIILPTTPNATYFERNAVMGIMNNHGSDSIVRIKELHINELIGRTTTALTFLDLYRITTVTSGEAITPIKHDTNATSLPSQVQVLKYPATATTTGSYLRRILSFTGLNATGALRFISGLRGGTCCAIGSGGMNLNHYFSSNDDNTQAYVLREGEGLALKTSLTSPQNYPIELTVHFSDGTNTFLVNEILNIQSTTELFAIHNGSGSGVVLTVSRIEFREIRDVGALYKVFTLESCSEMYDGTAIIPLALDSSNTAIDTMVEFKSNCVIRQGNVDAQQGRNARMGGDFIPFRRLVQPAYGKGVGLANGLFTIRPSINKAFGIDRINNVSDIVLREGEGIALLQSVLFGGWGNYEFSILFTVEDNGGVVSGGESSYVF